MHLTTSSHRPSQQGKLSTTKYFTVRFFGLFNIMVLISTWLEWSGMAFRNADAKRGMQQRFHQQKESIREDLRWVLLFNHLGWVWMVATQFQVSVLLSCQRIKRNKSTFFYLPADTGLLRRRYHSGLKVRHHQPKFSRPSGHGCVPFPHNHKQPAIARYFNVPRSTFLQRMNDYGWESALAHYEQQRKTKLKT